VRETVWSDTRTRILEHNPDQPGLERMRESTEYKSPRKKGTHESILPDSASTRGVAKNQLGIPQFLYFHSTRLERVGPSLGEPSGMGTSHVQREGFRSDGLDPSSFFKHSCQSLISGNAARSGLKYVPFCTYSAPWVGRSARSPVHCYAFPEIGLGELSHLITLVCLCLSPEVISSV